MTVPMMPVSERLEMQTLIVDPVTPRPYTSATLGHEPVGGTEATVIRIADAIDAVVMQHNRIENEGRYRTPSSHIEPTSVIVLREPSVALQMVKKYPRARNLLWLHDLAGPGTDRGKNLLLRAPELAAAEVTIICVSDFHARQVRATFTALPENQRPTVIRIYNPVDVSLEDVEKSPYDPNKLVFFSSPHKGLEYTLHVFSALHRKNKDLRLYIANPGYMPNLSNDWPGVVNLGAVPHHVILEHVRSSLCTFYPNYVYPETFGLVLAESNALGTPVLTHRIGAAEEVLCGDDQFIDVPRTRSVADSVFWRWPALRRIGEPALGRMGMSRNYEKRIRSWQFGNRPRVTARPEFSIDSVLEDWSKAIENHLVQAP